MRPMDELSQSPVLGLYAPVDSLQEMFPFGGSTAFNFLNYFLGTPEIASQVIENLHITYWETFYSNSIT